MGSGIVVEPEVFSDQQVQRVTVGHRQQMKRFFFDVTDLRHYLYSHTQLSGIQRVSVSAIAQARKKLGANSIWLTYYDKTRNLYLACPCPEEKSIDLFDYSELSKVLNISVGSHKLPGMAKYGNSPRRFLMRAAIWDIRAHLGDTRYFKRRGTTAKAWLTARAEYKQQLAERNKSENIHSCVDFRDVARRGDHLILLDNAWQPEGLDCWLSIAKNQIGLSVSVLLHDLIPLVRPQYTTSSICKKFYTWLQNSTNYVSQYIANSQSTASDLRDFLNASNATQSIRIVPLAQAQLPKNQIPSYDGRCSPYSDFKQHISLPDNIRVLTKNPYILIVGTMEVRKNLWKIAAVWDRLRWQSGRQLPKLVFAGRRGWLNDDFDALIEATGHLGGWVEIVEEPTDYVLDYLYRYCLFTMTVSFYEGWGLPIGESLAYGKTAVVSKTSSMPEVGGDMVEYCDPHCLDSIEQACLRLIDAPEHRTELEARIAATQLRTWDNVTHDILQAVLEVQ